ncbi:MAG: hypothetical protein KF846_08435 [Cyclobacteriaceae bacterium]|nr:hypothetical protein [Cyclobacteriaceae bacterium]
MTPSERFVARLCKQSFLPFWSFPNPVGKNSKELCDVLIVCGQHVVIISVKDIAVSSHSDENVQYERWVNKAINESVQQIYGAERFLSSVDEILAKDFKTKIKLPPKATRSIYRIAIAFGSKPNFPLPHGDFDKGFIHVFDEKSTQIVLNELDTINDFTTYLKAKEEFFENHFILIPSEADFLAIYLQTALKFDKQVDAIACGDDEWCSYVKSDDYKNWREDIKPSYMWDELIETIHKDHVNEHTPEERIHQIEEAVRYINLEPRINRIELGNVLLDAIRKKIKRRMLRPLPGAKHTYVFIPLSKKNWNAKASELRLCCAIARVENLEAETIIGIAIGRSANLNLLYDLCFLHLPEINDEFIKRVRAAQRELGFFQKTIVSNSKDFR